MGIDLIGRYLGLAVKGDEGHVGDLCTGGKTCLGVYGVGDIAHAPAGAVFRREKAGKDIGG